MKDLNNVKDLADLRPEDINTIGEEYGRLLADRNSGIKTNQVRNIFSSVQSIRTQMKMKKVPVEKSENKEKQPENILDPSIEQDLVLIKPKLAYATGRQRNVRPLYELLSRAIDLTTGSRDKNKSLDHFVRLVETIVAYHKFNGGN